MMVNNVNSHALQTFIDKPPDLTSRRSQLTSGEPDSKFQLEGALSSRPPSSHSLSKRLDSPTGDVSSKLSSAKETAGQSGGAAWVSSFREYDPNAKTTLPLMSNRIISAVPGSQHPGYDSITGASYEVPAGWKLTRTMSGIPYLIHMNTLEPMRVPYAANPDPNNNYPVPMLPSAAIGWQDSLVSVEFYPPPRPLAPAIGGLASPPEGAVESNEVKARIQTRVEGDGGPDQGQERRSRTEPSTMTASFGPLLDVWSKGILDSYLSNDRQAILF